MTEIQELRIRDAVADDAEAIGRVHVRAWKSAYRGIMPDTYLDNLHVGDRVEMWRSLIAGPNRSPLVVAVVAHEVVGFAAFGEERSSTPTPTPTPTPTRGELYAMNLDPDQWGRGFGRSLLRSVTQALIATGYREAVLWVVPQNVRARRLYESEGWAADGAQSTEEILGVTITDIRYRRSLVHP